MNGIGLSMRIAQAAALDAPAKDKRCGLPDRLIALPTDEAALITLTLDKKMSTWLNTTLIGVFRMTSNSFEPPP